MRLTVINGLPAHVLLVHIVVIFMPLAALLLILSSLWPAARRRLGIVSPIVALITLVAIPPTMNAGDWLARRVAPGPLVNAHTHIADTLLPFALGVFVMAALVWALYAKQHWFLRAKTSPAEDERVLVGSSVGSPSIAEADGESTALIEPGTQARGTATPVVPNWLWGVRIVAAVLAVAVSVGSVVDVYRIGDSGAKAAWNGNFSMAPKTGR
jgi:hypothetical protein